MSKSAKKTTQALARVAAAGPGPIVEHHIARVPAQRNDVILQLIKIAKDPNVDVTKIDRLISANERVMQIQAKAAFDRAFAKMQADLPIIAERGRIEVRDKQDPTKVKRRQPFARYADIVRACKPILGRHGFSVRFRHKFEQNILTVVGILSHEAGHSEEDEFVTGRDDSGEKSVIQSWGSARSFGERYVFRSLLAIASEEEDNDGNGPGPGTATPGDPEQAHHAKAGDAISDAQVRRFHVIVNKSNRADVDVKDWLRASFGYKSSREIKRLEYDRICTAIEARGALPKWAPAREPGQEG